MYHCPLLCMAKNCLQLAPEIFVDEQIDEEVSQVLNVHRKMKVSVDNASRVERIKQRGEGQNEDQEQTQTDLHRLHVTRFGTCCTLPEIESKLKVMSCIDTNI